MAADPAGAGSGAQSGAWSGARSGVARTVLRSRLSVLLCVAVVALTVAAAGGCLATARRTSTAFDRFVAWSDPPDVSIGGADEDEAEAFRAALATSPEIERFDYVYTIEATVVLADGSPLTFDQAAPLILGSATAGGRLKVLDGRLPDPASSDEVVVTAVTAERLGLAAGDEVTLLTDAGGVPMRVAAVAAAASEFPTVGGRTLSFLAAMPGFMEAHPDLVATHDSTAAVWLRDGTEGLPAFRAQGDELGLSDLDLDDQAEVTMGVNRILHTDAVALVIAGLLGRAGRGHDPPPAPTPGSRLGRRRPPHPWHPRGAARRPRRRWRARRRAHRCGSAPGRGWPWPWRRRGSPPSVSPASPSPISGWRSTPRCSWSAWPSPSVVGALIGAWCVVRAGRTVTVGRSTTIRGIPEPAATGVRFALAPEGGGVGGQARMGLAGLAISVALLVAVAVIGGTLSHVQSRPELSGGWWDGFVGVWDEQGAAGLEAGAGLDAGGRARRAGRVAGRVRAGRAPGRHDVRRPRGRRRPCDEPGRAPVGPHEVALGPATLAAMASTSAMTSRWRSLSRTTRPRARWCGWWAVRDGRTLWFTMAPGEGALVTTAFAERWEPVRAGGRAHAHRGRRRRRRPTGPGRSAATTGLGPDELISFARSAHGDIEALSGLTRVPVALAVVLLVLAG